MGGGVEVRAPETALGESQLEILNHPFRTSPFTVRVHTTDSLLPLAVDQRPMVLQARMAPAFGGRQPRRPRDIRSSQDARLKIVQNC